MRILKRINSKVNIALTELYLLLKTISKKESSEGSGILMLQGGNIGDGLLDTPAIVALAAHYAKKGEDAYLICPQSMWDVISLIDGMEKVTFLNFCDGKNITLKSARKIMASVGKHDFDVVAAFVWISPTWKFLATSIHAGRTYTLDMPFHGKGRINLMRKIVQRYANTIPGASSICRQTQLAMMMREMGLTQYHSSIACFGKRFDCDLIDKSSTYLVLSVDSSTVQRRWPAERFIRLASCLLQKCSYSIVLVGNSLADDVKGQYERAFHNNRRIQDLIGKTDIYEWIGIIQNAKFLVGVDSGSIHVAASVGVPSFCLTGAWDGRRFVPYQIEEETPNTVEPICVMWERVEEENLSCYDCYSKGDIGKGNTMCKRLCGGVNHVFASKKLA